MTYELRPYQQEAVDNIYSAWRAGHRAVLYLSGTGTGKTVVFSHIMREHTGVSLEISHRKELVDQASITLARRGVRHSIMAPQNVVKLICKEHVRETGQCWYDPHARHHVVSVRTMLARQNNPQYKAIFQQATLLIIDECHHALRKNEYGKVVDLLPNAKILGVTATSQRTDGQGLGTHHDGFFDTLVEGPPASWMMQQGYLTPYRIVAPVSKIDYSPVNITSGGDYNQKKLSKQTADSAIIGDAVESYLQFAPGKIGATFYPSVELSKQQAERYNAAGIPAAHLDGKTPTQERAAILRDLRAGRILQLCNVDLISEGFDLPALEVITICRRTASLIWHLQVSGRVLRTMEGKTHGLIIDHVGNYLDPRLGLPDSPRTWTLDRRNRKKQDKSGVIPTKVCLNPECMLVYERYHPVCPYCGYKPPVTARTEPEQVDGDLVELTPDMLQQLGVGAENLARPVDEVREEYMRVTGGDRLIANSNAARHRKNQELQEELRAEILRWRFQGPVAGLSDAECYRRFFLATGKDVLTAQGLKGKELREMITTMKKRLK